MLTADHRRKSRSTIPVNELVHYLTGANQQAFVRLRLTLGLGLRRQLLIAVCDDLALRNAMAEKLAHDLPRLHDLSAFLPLELGIAGRQVPVDAVDQLLTLTLHPQEATTIGQIVQQLKHDPQRPKFGVQLLGIEQLTRQPVHIQRAFLNHLRAVGRNFVHLDANMLLWVTRPWLRSIQQSSPEFWRWRTGIFEFEGDPLPAGALVNPPAITEKPRISDPDRVSKTDRVSEPDSVPAAALLPFIQASVEQLTQPVAPGRESEPGVVTNAPLVEEEESTAIGDQSIVIESDELLRAPIGDGAAVVVPSVDLEAPLETRLLPEPLAVPQADCQPRQPSQEERDFANLVLAAVMQQVVSHPEDLLQTENPNPDHAIFEPLRILQQVENLPQQGAAENSVAAVYRELGDYYRNHHELTLQIASAVAGEHLMLGIKSYELACKFLDGQADAVPEIGNDIANLYWMLSRVPSETANSRSHLETAIGRYQAAIDAVDAAANPYTLAMLENNLGAAYSDMALQCDPSENLTRSIAAYEMALQKRPVEVDPQRYAATQNNLGTAYWNLGQHEALATNLQRAIRAYSEALQIYNPEEEPLHYAMIQNNIGTAYWNLAQCDLDTDSDDAPLHATPETLLKLAISAYRTALLYRTRETTPLAYAATRNNLGTAYWHLANQPATKPDEVRGYLLHAIFAYHGTIMVSEEIDQPLPFDLAATRNNLAAAYHQAATNRHAELDMPTRLSYLNQSLDKHLEAIQAWQSNPDLQESALHGLVQTIRSIHEYQGSQGQTQALSKLPATVLTDVMRSL